MEPFAKESNPDYLSVEKLQPTFIYCGYEVKYYSPTVIAYSGYPFAFPLNTALQIQTEISTFRLLILLLQSNGFNMIGNAA